MAQLRLHYFDFPGGRAEPARIALKHGNIPFEDVRFPPQDLAKLAPDFPLRQVPVLEVDGVAITQSNSINRYVGKLTGLYPDDQLQALLCDEIMDAIEDLITKVIATFSMEEEQKKAVREDLCANTIPVYINFLDKKLEVAGGDYFADQRLTMCDLKAFFTIRHLSSGALDHVPADLVSQQSPLLIEHMQRVQNHPVFKA